MGAARSAAKTATLLAKVTRPETELAARAPNPDEAWLLGVDGT